MKHEEKDHRIVVGRKWKWCFLLLTVWIGILCSETVVCAAGGVSSKLNGLKSKFPAGRYWNHMVTAYSNNADVLMANWDESYADSVTASPCATHSGPGSVGQYDCNFFDGGMQCYGFARKVFYDVFGQKVSTLPMRYDVQNIMVGDYVRVNSDSHSGVVLSRNGNTITLVECNVGGRCLIGWGSYSYSISNVTHFVHASNYNQIDDVITPNPQPNITWTTSVSEITETNAKVSARITVPSTVTFQWVGCNFFDANGRAVGQAGENVSYTQDHLDIWFNINQETWDHISLKPGLKYQYQFYATYGGVDHFSPMYSFTTAGTHTHTYAETVIKNATCTTAGSKKYTCTCAECGYSYTQTINASGHSWDSGKVQKAATCTDDGEMIYTCTFCGDTKTETIEKTGHRYVTEVVAPTTHSKGYTEYKCSVCGDSYASDYVDPLPEPEQPGTGTTPQTPTQPGTASTPKKPSGVALPAAKQLPVGTVITNIAGGNYKVTGTNTVAFTKPAGKKKTVYIPTDITVNGVVYRVTSIAANAFKNNKKLKKVTIGADIEKIGANAFRGCKNLKQIYVDTKKLKKSRVGKKAFAGISKKAVFRIVSSKTKLYKKIFKSKGAPSTAKYKIWL